MAPFSCQEHYPFLINSCYLPKLRKQVGVTSSSSLDNGSIDVPTGDNASVRNGGVVSKTRTPMEKRENSDGTCMEYVQSKRSNNGEKKSSGEPNEAEERKRARREKIEGKMNLLISLVPGGDKASGRVVMLDEAINYLQSLQIQVELLSMKLDSVEK